MEGGAKSLMQAARHGSYTRPKTVLGFFWAIVATVISGALFAIWAVHAADKARFIPWILAFAALVILGTIGVVVVAMFKDPTKLMLGEMSGDEYTSYRALTLGDSLSGERIETMPARRGHYVPNRPAALGTAPDEEITQTEGTP